MSKKDKYPPYPDSAWDYAVIHTASINLRKPNKFICIYCHAQAVLEKDILHVYDCPARTLDPAIADKFVQVDLDKEIK